MLDKQIRQYVDHVVDRNRRSGTIAKHSRLDSSIMLSIRNLRPLVSLHRTMLNQNAAGPPLRYRKNATDLLDRLAATGGHQ